VTTAIVFTYWQSSSTEMTSRQLPPRRRSDAMLHGFKLGINDEQR
jgi:hypothetical protein